MVEPTATGLTELEARLQKEVQLREQSQADSATKSRELWLLREKLAQQQASYQDQVSVLRASLHAIKKRQPPAAVIPEAVADDASKQGIRGNYSQANSAPDTPKTSDQLPVTQQFKPDPKPAPRQQTQQPQQPDQHQSTPCTTDGSADTNEEPAQPASADSCLRAAKQLLVIANKLQELVGTLSTAQPAAAADLSVMQWQLTATCNLLSAQQSTADAISSSSLDQCPLIASAGCDAGAAAAAACGSNPQQEPGSGLLSLQASEQCCLLTQAACAAARLFSGAACAQPVPLLWFYLDDADSIRGPFDAATMLRWHCQGFLEDSLPVVALVQSPTATAAGPLLAPEPQAFMPLQQLLMAVAGGHNYRALEPEWGPTPVTRSRASSTPSGSQSRQQGAGRQERTPTKAPRQQQQAVLWEEGVPVHTPPGRSKAWLAATRLNPGLTQQQVQSWGEPMGADEASAIPEGEGDAGSSGGQKQQLPQTGMAGSPGGESSSASPADAPSDLAGLGFGWLSAPQVALSHPLAAVQQMANMFLQAVQLDTPRTSPEPSPSPSPERLPRSTRGGVMRSSPSGSLLSSSASPSPHRWRVSSSMVPPAARRSQRRQQQQGDEPASRQLRGGFAASAGHAGELWTWAASPDGPDAAGDGGAGGGSSGKKGRSRRGASSSRAQELQREAAEGSSGSSSNSGAGAPGRGLIQLAGRAAPAAGGIGQLLSGAALADSLHQALRALSPEPSPRQQGSS